MSESLVLLPSHFPPSLPLRTISVPFSCSSRARGAVFVCHSFCSRVFRLRPRPQSGSRGGECMSSRAPLTNTLDPLPALSRPIESKRQIPEPKPIDVSFRALKDQLYADGWWERDAVEEAKLLIPIVSLIVWGGLPFLLSSLRPPRLHTTHAPCTTRSWTYLN